ncbi:hypothetical protein [Promicromonospora sp. NPDC023987]|uniref:hypothetical protein n=1 Tax=Promicromonospora sp. NPDC023987 TaxID=3155360 RepID=UPI0034063F5E
MSLRSEAGVGLLLRQPMVSTSTFALEPRRVRVMVAKNIPPVIATLAVNVIMIVIGYAIVQISRFSSDLPVSQRFVE